MRRLFCFLLLLPSCTVCDALTTERFKEWYWYDDTFKITIHKYCSAEYARYRGYYDGHVEVTRTYDLYMDLITCILDNINDLNKANIASAGVLLGLMPTILAYAGSNLSETALLSVRRPLLAFLLAIGSPAVPPRRTFEHQDILGMLKRRKNVFTMKFAFSRGSVTKALIVGVELTLALAAIANVVLMSYELGMTTFVAWSADTFFHPLLWNVATGVVHLCGLMVLRRDVRIVSPPSRCEYGIRQRILYWAKDEFTPCAWQKHPTTLEYRPDTFWFLFASWLSATLTLGHYIYGTVVFTSALFISVPASLIVLVRFLASTMCCRIIVMYELSGMRQVSQSRLDD
ncbi:hypothetical protein K469DRAFT_646390 [Zopfia rhizophila CBS 207.26]|uniref:Uncharacterized protein n=1 Tax=Zopfia rhizophila CBS 207.26 TaxID=1314779 RepID=A0A6A6DA61_9PEZI|nr:hypothetical protein K469DRAFT_646390 [Zopfia rhizophila CBS 207.26]